MVGAVVGASGGLIAVALPLAILARDASALVYARGFGLLGFCVSAPVGWILGGQIGPRLEKRFGEKNGGIIGGIVGGLVPVIGFALWGLWMITRRR